MKRDMKLIRDMLLYLDEREGASGLEIVPIDGYDPLAIRYHQVLLAQAGFVDHEPTVTNSGRIISTLVFGLTWSGQEFLSSLKNDTVWQKLRQKLGSRLAEVPVTVIYEVATGLATRWAKDQVGLP